MTSADLVPVDNMAALDELTPEARDLAVTQMLDQAHHWLAHAKEASAPARDIANFKAFVASAADAARRVKVSKEIQLDADEMVRRSERQLGVSVREGQAAGEIAKTGDIGGGGRHGDKAASSRRSSHDHLDSPSNYFGTADERGHVYQMTDGVSDDQFDEAIEEAKAEGNLSRANVVRKVKGQRSPESRLERARLIEKLAGEGYSSRQIASKIGITFEATRDICRDHDIEVPADEFVKRTKRIDSTRVARQTVFAVQGAAAGLELIDYQDIDPAEIADWAVSLSESMRALNRFVKQIKEMAQ